MPNVSVIIPTYNHAPYLSQAIKSVLEQIFTDLEVVVVDDGSTDNTAEVMTNFAGDNRVRYIQQPNQGLSQARNNGFKVSSGEYINFLDADDYFHPEKIQKQVDILNQNPRYAFTYCDITRVNENGEKLDDHYSTSSERETLTGNLMGSLILGGYFPPLSVLMRRSMLDEIGLFEPGLDGHADYDLWLRASGKGKEAFFQNEKLAFYRVLSNSMSTNQLHMAETKKKALTRCAQMFPQAFAEAVDHLHQMNNKLFAANRWLSASLASHEGDWKKLQSDLEQLQAQNLQINAQFEKFQLEKQYLLTEVQKRDAAIEKLRRLK